MNILVFLVACGAEQADIAEPFYLTKENYEWSCKDYQDYSDIVVQTNTCEDIDTGLRFMIAEYFITDGDGFKRRMEKTDNWEIDCKWQTNFPLLEEYCIQVEGVTVTAFFD